MKKYFYLLSVIFSLSYGPLLAQSPSIEDSIEGAWRLVSQITTLPDNRIMNMDSSNLIQEKMFTGHHYMVITEAMINNQKRFIFCAGGHCVFNKNECTEINEYASYSGYELVKAYYTFTIKGNTMTQVGSVTHQNGTKSQFQEVYVRDR